VKAAPLVVKGAPCKWPISCWWTLHL